MKNKKIIAVLAAMAMMMTSLSGCSGNKDTKESPKKESSVNEGSEFAYVPTVTELTATTDNYNVVGDKAYYIDLSGNNSVEADWEGEAQVVEGTEENEGTEVNEETEATEGNDGADATVEAGEKTAEIGENAEGEEFGDSDDSLNDPLRLKSVNLKDGQEEDVCTLEAIPEGYFNGHIALGDDGSMYLTAYLWGSEEDGAGDDKVFIYKYNADGEIEAHIEFGSVLQSQYVSVAGIAFDSNQNVIVSDSEGNVGVVDKDLNFVTKSQLNADNVFFMGVNEKNEPFIVYSNYDEATSTVTSGMKIFKNAKAGETEDYEDISVSSLNCVSVLSDGTYVLQDYENISTYVPKDNKMEKIVSLLDCDIVSDTVRCFKAWENGDYSIINIDYESGNSSLSYLTKTDASQVVKKEDVVIGTMYSGSISKQAILAFNKQSDKYRVKVVTYLDTDDWSDESYMDAISDMTNAVLSTDGSCPDLMEISLLNINSGSVSDAICDLNEYMDDSFKNNIFESCLAGYNVNGKQLAIPKTFSVETMAGKKDIIGDVDHLSFEDVEALVDKYPDCEIIDYMDQATMLQLFLYFNLDKFIDYSTGECNFDNDEFKSVLKFAARFPEEYDYDSRDSSASKLANGTSLMEMAYLMDFRSMQEVMAHFGTEDVAFVGYPTFDGSCGTFLTTNDALGICENSDSKEGAWEFLKFYLGYKDESSSYGFSSFKDEFEKAAKEACEHEYVKDENGELVLDENGEPIIAEDESYGGVSYEDGWTYEYHAVSEEEVELTKEIINKARPLNLNIIVIQKIFGIISEEVQPFFKGQKSVDDVSSVVQNRVQLYFKENS
ncbi:MAG: hypothetical protein K6F84_07665 [Lachnospiraceae bacterium]|nr:hypothetical protein [Lachnospiraceae bacterium]